MSARDLPLIFAQSVAHADRFSPRRRPGKAGREFLRDVYEWLERDPVGALYSLAYSLSITMNGDYTDSERYERRMGVKPGSSTAAERESFTRDLYTLIWAPFNTVHRVLGDVRALVSPATGKQRQQQQQQREKQSQQQPQPRGSNDGSSVTRVGTEDPERTAPRTLPPPPPLPSRLNTPQVAASSSSSPATTSRVRPLIDFLDLEIVDKLYADTIKLRRQETASDDDRGVVGPGDDDSGVMMEGASGNPVWRFLSSDRFDRVLAASPTGVYETVRGVIDGPSGSGGNNDDDATHMVTDDGEDDSMIIDDNETGAAAAPRERYVRCERARDRRRFAAHALRHETSDVFRRNIETSLRELYGDERIGLTPVLFPAEEDGRTFYWQGEKSACLWILLHCLAAIVRSVANRGLVPLLDLLCGLENFIECGSCLAHWRKRQQEHWRALRDSLRTENPSASDDAPRYVYNETYVALCDIDTLLLAAHNAVHEDERAEDAFSDAMLWNLRREYRNFALTVVHRVRGLPGAPSSARTNPAAAHLCATESDTYKRKNKTVNARSVKETLLAAQAIREAPYVPLE